MLIDGEFAVNAPPQALLQHLFDARLMASCLPGCETLELLDADRYRAVVLISMAGIDARFDLQVQITQREADRIGAIVRGEEGGRASTLQAESQITLTATPEGTRVSYRADVSLTGRLGRFALGMMKKKAQSLGAEFAANLQQKLQELGAPAAAGAPVAASAAARGATLQAPAASAARKTGWQAWVMWWRGVWAAMSGAKG